MKYLGYTLSNERLLRLLDAVPPAGTRDIDYGILGLFFETHASDPFGNKKDDEPYDDIRIVPVFCGFGAGGPSVLDRTEDGVYESLLRKDERDRHNVHLYERKGKKVAVSEVEAPGRPRLYERLFEHVDTSEGVPGFFYFDAGTLRLACGMVEELVLSACFEDTYPFHTERDDVDATRQRMPNLKLELNLRKPTPAAKGADLLPRTAATSISALGCRKRWTAPRNQA